MVGLESATEFIERKTKRDTEREKIIKVKNIERTGHNFWKIEKRVFMPQTNHGRKVFTFERLSFVKSTGKKTKQAKVGKKEYRIGYYIVGHHGNKKDKWTWGQYCPFIPVEDYNKLIELAKKNEVLV